MRIENCTVSLTNEDVQSLFAAIPLPEGLKVSRADLRENGVDVQLESGFLGFPTTIRLRLESYQGAQIRFTSSPPLRLVGQVDFIREVSQPSGLPAHNHLELDLLLALKPWVSAATIERIFINEESAVLEVSGVDIPQFWSASSNRM